MITFGAALRTTAVYFAQAGGGLGGLWWWVIPFLLVAAGCYYFVLIYPKRYLSEQFRPEVKDRLELENDYRSTYAQIVGGAFVVLGFIGTVYSLRESHNLYELNRRGQEAERFTKALAQLGKTDELSRTGGIFALESIADISQQDYRWPVANVFATYIRKFSCPESPAEQGRAKVKPEKAEGAAEKDSDDDETEKAEGPTRWTGGLPCPNQQRPRAVSSDVQEVLSFIKAERVADARGNLVNLNLSQSNLREANLRDGHLAGVLFRGVYGVLADFTGADLRSANFQPAIMTPGAVADLKCAIFVNADLRVTSFNQANLRGANFLGAKFDKSTSFNGANMKAANLVGADLSELNESSLTQKQLDAANVSKETTKLPGHGKLQFTPESLVVKNNPNCDPTGFGGTMWSFDKEASLRLGGDRQKPLPQLLNVKDMTLIVRQDERQIRVEFAPSWDQNAAGWDDPVNLPPPTTYGLDGNETPQEVPGGKPGAVTLQAVWMGGYERLELVKVIRPNPPGDDAATAVTEDWELSPDGKVLTIWRYIVPPQGAPRYSYPLVFNKPAAR